MNLIDGVADLYTSSTKRFKDSQTGGVLSYIVTNKWLTVRLWRTTPQVFYHAQGICLVEQIIDVGQAQLFQDADTLSPVLWQFCGVRKQNPHPEQPLPVKEGRA
jgi:hypothetical protein